MRRALGVCVVAAALAAAAGAANPAVNGRIGYLRPLGGNEPPDAHLFAIDPDGSGAVDLTPVGYVDVRSFAWSPDGRRIAFSALPDDHTAPEIFVMSADGSDVRRLTNNQLPDFGPSWSPDGKSIAFTSIRTGLSQIYRMGADGSAQRRLTNTFGNCDSPAWSPRGNLIAFHCGMAMDKVSVMRPDGSHIRTLLRSAPNTIETDPAWSPDGRLIAFGRGTRGPAWASLGVWTIRPDGRGVHRVTTDGGAPAWSPDGRWIAFVALRNGNQELYKVSSAGGDAVQLTETYGIVEGQPDWQRGT
jgi:Tol biopolymer transport system component